jgi:hypothetical protein
LVLGVQANSIEQEAAGLAVRMAAMSLVAEVLA